MTSIRRYIPSLDALIFFEAAARQASFTGAANELYVTQSAVSKRIRELEETLGIKLFHRDGPKLRLTEAGQRFQQSTRMALEYIEDACKQVVDETSDVIRIVSYSTFSLFWLTPRLKAFGLGEHSSNIAQYTSDRPRDITNRENDLAIIYGDGKVPGWDCELIFMETLVPLASPDYAKQFVVRDSDEPKNNQLTTSMTLLEFPSLVPDWINWPKWIEKTANPLLSDCAIQQCRTYNHAIGAAINGEGVVLACHGIVKDELDTGQLVIVSDDQLPTGRGYFLATPTNKPISNATRILRDYLLDKG